MTGTISEAGDVNLSHVPCLIPQFLWEIMVFELLLLFVCFTFMFVPLILIFVVINSSDLFMLISSEQQYSFLFIILVQNVTVEIYKRSKKSPEIPESIFQTMF
jgi:hypothetical protein